MQPILFVRLVKDRIRYRLGNVPYKKPLRVIDYNVYKVRAYDKQGRAYLLKWEDVEIIPTNS